MLHIRPMTHGDIPFGTRLSAQAGWNQLEADWRRAVDLGSDGCFVATLDGLDVGTVATCRFGTVAWIGLMLVDRSVRRRGVGRALMTQALEYLDASGATTIRLDATPLGQPLYEQLGFMPEYTLCRYAGIPRGTASPSPIIVPFEPSQLETLLALDRWATATDRSLLLRRLLAEGPDSVRVITRGGKFVGFLASRPGRNAIQVGPCVAEPGAGTDLLGDAWRRFHGKPVYIDVPDANVGAVHTLTEAGLTGQRPFVRMCRGTSIGDNRSMLWAAFGPEKG